MERVPHRWKVMAIVAIVAIVLSAFYLRIIPYFKYSKFGIWLQYDDSMFEYWLSKTLYTHGLGYWYKLTPQNTKYLWWWPQGRDVRKTETPGLSFTGAGLYPIIKSFGLRLVDWVGIIPAFYGTLAVLSASLLGFVTGGPLLAVITGASVAYQYAFMQRSIASFVEKMAPCLFFGTLYLVALTVFNKNYKKSKTKYVITPAILGGIVLMFAAAFWGGFLMFVGITTILVFLLPYFSNDHEYYTATATFVVITAITFFLTSLWITTLWMHKLWLFTLMIFVLTLIYLGLGYTVNIKFNKNAKKIWTVIVIASLILLAAIASHPYVTRTLLSGRYLMMVLPWLRRAESPLARSVAEHQGILDVYKINDLINVIGIGIAVPFALLIALYKTLSGSKDEVLIALPTIALGLFATYMLFSNTSVYLLTPIGYLSALAGALALYWSIGSYFTERNFLKRTFWALAALLLVTFLVVGSLSGIRFAANYPPPSFLSAGTALYSPLFPEAMKEVHKYCHFVLAWWDYGYMLGTVAHATTAVDPATLNATKISLVAKALVGNETKIIDVLKSFRMLTNKTCIFAYEVFPLLNNKTVLLAPQAGDFAKSVWMFRIAGYKDKIIFSKYIKTYYVVVGLTPAGKQVALLVKSPKAIQVTQGGILVRTPNGGTVLLSKVLAVSARPVYDIKDVFLYKMIYMSLVKSGYKVLDSLGRPVNVHIAFKHFELMKPTIAYLYVIKNDGKLKPINAIGVVALLRYKG